MTGVLIYLFLFLISYLLFAFGEKLFYARRKIGCAFFWSLGIFLLCFFAGARAESVGKDVIGYISTSYLDAQTNSLHNYLLMNNRLPEFLYYTINYFCSKLPGKYFFILFINQMLIIIPVFLSFLSMKKKVSISFGMLVYMILFYNLSLCYMRQFIACSFLLLGYSFLEKKKNKAAFLVFIVAAFFHILSLLGVLIILINKLSRNNSLLSFSFLFCFFTFILLAKNIANFLLTSNLISSKIYLAFTHAVSNATSINWGDLLLYISVCFLMLFNRKGQKCFSSFFVINMSIIMMILADSLVSTYFYRLAYYSKFFLLIEIPIITGRAKRITSTKFLYLLWAFVHWIWFTVILDIEQTKNYHFTDLSNIPISVFLLLLCSLFLLFFCVISHIFKSSKHFKGYFKIVEIIR